MVERVCLGITPACAGKTKMLPLKAGVSQDHPRVCGKNLNVHPTPHRVMGSPPRVREKLKWVQKRTCKAGITPACAGKTLVLQSAPIAHRDHPRVCGKNLINCSSAGRSVGSPPRVREKQTSTSHSEGQNRITPACAGKTAFPMLIWLVPWDHPRVCGKNYL